MHAIALKKGFVDQPGHRKIHTQPIALGGGIVLFWVILLPIIAVIGGALYLQRFETPSWLSPVIGIHIQGLASRARMVLWLCIAAGSLHVLGLIDDVRHLGPKVKLAAQFAAAAMIVWGARIRFDFFIPIPLLTGLLSVLWIVVIVNAFNFLDNMDGLSAGIAAICAAMIFSAAWTSGQVFVCGMLALLIGSLCGFLLFNFYPARIFMGDSGSLVVGLLIAVATIQTTYYQQDQAQSGWYTTLMPVIILAVPLYDFCSVTILRLLQGKSPFVGDQQHFSHRLLRRGMTQSQAVLTIYLATACTGLGATILNQLNHIGVILVFLQTLMILAIIAILEGFGPDYDKPIQ